LDGDAFVKKNIESSQNFIAINCELQFVEGEHNLDINYVQDECDRARERWRGEGVSHFPWLFLISI